MPLEVKCPCKEQNATFDFKAEQQVDDKGNVIATGLRFDKDALQRAAYDQSFAYWDRLSKSIRCPEPCLETMSGVFEDLPMKVDVYTVRAGNPPVVHQSFVYTATARLTFGVSCRKPE